MATWPSANLPVTTTTDADSDSISGARVDINKTIANQIEIVDMFNIPASPTDNYILVYNAGASRFEVEASPAFTGDLNGNDLTDSTGEVNIVDSRVNIKPNNTDDRSVNFGDELFLSPNYPLTSAVIDGAEERWAFLFLDEHSNGSFPKSIGGGNFTNPTIAGRIQGGTPGNEVGVKSGGRLLSFQAFAGQDDDGAGTNYVLPSSANFRILGETTEVQRTSGNGGRGTKLRIDTIATGSQSSVISADIQGNQFRVAPDESTSSLKGGGDFTISTNTDGDIILSPTGTSSSVQVEKPMAWGPINNTGSTVIDGDNSRIYADGAGGIVLGGSTQTGNIDVQSQFQLSSQATGTPSNTTTPTGYIEIDINGTTRYIPYYT